MNKQSIRVGITVTDSDRAITGHLAFLGGQVRRQKQLAQDFVADFPPVNTPSARTDIAPSSSTQKTTTLP